MIYNRNARLLTAISFLLSSMFIVSCQKEQSSATSEEPTTEVAASSASEATAADGSFDDLDEITQVTTEEDDYASSDMSSSGRYFPKWLSLRKIIGDCGTITVSTTDGSFPKTITLDFGDSCKGRDEKVRSGKIVIHLTAPRRKPGSVATVTLVNYSLNHIDIAGTKVVTNLSRGNTIAYGVAVIAGRVTFPNGNGYSFESEKTRTQIGGQATDEIADNVFEIKGAAHVKFNTGLSIVLTVVDPLIKKVSCSWRSDGTVKLTVNKNFTAKLDYGFPNNGDCDNKALLSWNNDQRVVILP